MTRSKTRNRLFQDVINFFSNLCEFLETSLSRIVQTESLFGLRFGGQGYHIFLYRKEGKFFLHHCCLILEVWAVASSFWKSRLLDLKWFVSKIDKCLRTFSRRILKFFMIWVLNSLLFAHEITPHKSLTYCPTRKWDLRISILSWTQPIVCHNYSWSKKLQSIFCITSSLNLMIDLPNTKSYDIKSTVDNFYEKKKICKATWLKHFFQKLSCCKKLSDNK